MKTNSSSSKRVSFADYSTLLQTTNYIQYGKIKGTLFFTPKSFWLWTQIQNFLDRQFAKLKVENVHFPSFITKEALAKEAHHVAGFQPEVLEITRAGTKQLKEPFYLRPTSEVLFAQYFCQVVKSYRDLPLLLNQWVNVWRWEQNPKPFFRNIEFLWQEGHTLHGHKAQALALCQKIYQIYQDLVHKFLLIPTFKGNKSPLEKFAGANETWALETLTPDGQFLQLATVHYLGQTFAKAFRIQFLNATNHLATPFQTSWGVSTRLLAGLIITHMDHYGLKFPFHLAKTQIVVFGYLTTTLTIDQRQQLKVYINSFLATLTEYRVVYCDLSTTKKSLSYWQKHYWQEGVALQITLGNTELAAQKITYQTRHQPNQVQQVLRTNWVTHLPQVIQNYNQALFDVAQNYQRSHVVPITNYAQYQAIPVKDAAYSVTFCGRTVCEQAIKADTGTVSRVLIPYPVPGTCFRCQKPASFTAFFGRSY